MKNNDMFPDKTDEQIPQEAPVVDKDKVLQNQKIIKETLQEVVKTLIELTKKLDEYSAKAERLTKAGKF